MRLMHLQLMHSRLMHLRLQDASAAAQALQEVEEPELQQAGGGGRHWRRLRSLCCTRLRSRGCKRLRSRCCRRWRCRQIRRLHVQDGWGISMTHACALPSLAMEPVVAILAGPCWLASALVLAAHHEVIQFLVGIVPAEPSMSRACFPSNSATSPRHSVTDV